MQPKILLFVAVLSQLASAQALKRIYVDGVVTGQAVRDTRQRIIADLRKLQSVQVVDSAQAADEILTGAGEIYVKGYYSLNPRSGVAPGNGHPVFGGYLSVELKDSRGRTVWSYLANASDSRDAARELSKDVVKHLAQSLNNPAAGKM
jgi:hypothetical protein